MKWLEYYDKPDNKISEDFQPSVPKVSKEEYDTIVIPNLIKWGAIPKSKLEVSKSYN